MFKKMLSGICTAVILLMLMPVSANAENPISIDTFNVSPNYLDPSPEGDDEFLTVNYSLNKEADEVTIEIRNFDGELVRTFISSTEAEKVSGTFTWDGIYANRLAVPGSYSVLLVAVKSGEDSTISEKTFNIEYPDSNKPDISGFDVNPDSFDPDFEDVTIDFENTEDAYLTFEIQNTGGERVRTYTDYKHDFYNANDYHSLVWDGKNDVGIDVVVGTYKAYLVARNDYGVVVEEQSITVDNSGGSISPSNSHIEDIYFSPSTFEPAEDDELEIEFDINKDLDDLRVMAVKGNDEIEIFDNNDVEEENNFEVLWEGTDEDDDYVEPGTWKIRIETSVDGTDLIAEKSLSVRYDKPNIDEFYLSKDRFDPDFDEFTNILFRIEDDANVTIEILEDEHRDETVIEEMEVEADQWYAIEWDGEDYDYDDDLEIKLIAENPVMEDVYDTETENVNLVEDSVSSSRSNITQDYIAPVITDGDEDMQIFYNLEDDADVTISIRKGTSSSGSEIIELMDVEDQSSGDHTVIWNGRDEDGDRLSKGLYTYKITSRKSNSESESGIFVVGNLGDIDSGSPANDSDDNKISPHVISIDDDSYGDYYSDFYDNCAGFSDVPSNSPYCQAIQWARNEGIFSGYSDGSFKPYQPINRVEVLKVVLEALDINLLPMDYVNLVFDDIEAGAWYMPYIGTGLQLGIFHGDSGKNTARPADTVNRAEALKLIFEALRINSGYQPQYCSFAYSDVSAGSWYYTYACASNRYSIVEGVNLYPANLSTRGEIADMLFKLHEAGLI